MLTISSGVDLLRNASKSGGGGGTAIYGLYRYVPLWRVWFSSSLLWDRVYKSESLGLEQGIIFQGTDQLVEDFIGGIWRVYSSIG